MVCRNGVLMGHLKVASKGCVNGVLKGCVEMEC